MTPPFLLWLPHTSSSGVGNSTNSTISNSLTEVGKGMQNWMDNPFFVSLLFVAVAVFYYFFHYKPMKESERRFEAYNKKYNKMSIEEKIEQEIKNGDNALFAPAAIASYEKAQALALQKISEENKNKK